MRRIALLAGVLVGTIPFAPGIAGGQPHPRDYVRVFEVRDSSGLPSGDTLGRVMDRRNNILIHFDREALLQALIGQTRIDTVRIRVEASLQQGDGAAQPIEVDNFIEVTETSGTLSAAPTFQFVYSDKRVDVDRENKILRGVLPDSFINLTRLGVSAGDRLYLKITDVETQNDLDFIVDIDTFGLNTRVTDSFLLLRRLGVTEDLKAEDFQEINFRPAPGTTFGWVYRARTNPVLRVLTPGFGYNVSFTDWGDSAFDIATGKFTKGTQSSNVEIGTGIVLTLFHDTLHLSYGWNLNVESNRRYFGIGFSFFNLSRQIGGLVTD